MTIAVVISSNSLYNNYNLKSLTDKPLMTNMRLIY